MWQKRKRFVSLGKPGFRGSKSKYQPVENLNSGLVTVQFRDDFRPLGITSADLERNQLNFERTLCHIQLSRFERVYQNIFYIRFSLNLANIGA